MSPVGHSAFAKGALAAVALQARMHAFGVSGAARAVDADVMHASQYGAAVKDSALVGAGH